MKEVDELKSLLPEIQIKIDDSLESARSLTKVSPIYNYGTKTNDAWYCEFALN